MTAAEHGLQFDTVLQRYGGTRALHALRRAPEVWEAASPFIAFARLGHTLATGPGTASERCAKLDELEGTVLDAFHGNPSSAVFAGLNAAAGVPVTPLLEMLQSFRTEAVGAGFRDFAALEAFCRQSAGSAGSVLMHLAGVADPQTLARADELAVALRLVDIIVDVGRDARRDIVMIPVPELSAFEVSNDDLRAGDTRGCDELIAFQIARARTWLARARPLANRVGGPLHDLIIAAREQASDCLDAIEAGTLDPFADH